MMLSIVYVLTNPAMPGLVKIGHTSADDAQSRLAQLYTSGVPFPFKLEFAAKVANPEEVERALHQAFAPQRPNPRREFFQIEPDQAIAILKLLHTEEVTNEIANEPGGAVTNAAVSQAEVNAGDEYAARRPNLNFSEMGIPIGSVLTFRDGDSTVVVASAKKVRIDDETLSLSAVTKTLLGTPYNVAPGPYWTFNGRSLREIYDETYS